MRMMIAALGCILMMVLCGACSKNRICDEPDENHGLILASVTDLCLPALGSKTYVIRDEASYQLLFPSAECAERIEIDFRTHSLLGFLVAGQGCSVKFRREVRIDKEAFQYIYKITSITCGKCKEESISYNWVIVPRLLPDWTVRFVAE